MLPKLPLGASCAYCGQPAIGWDHIVPRSRGGSNTPENLAPACRKCNSSKSNRTPEEWMAVPPKGPDAPQRLQFALSDDDIARIDRLSRHMRVLSDSAIVRFALLVLEHVPIEDIRVVAGDGLAPPAQESSDGK